MTPDDLLRGMLTMMLGRTATDGDVAAWQADAPKRAARLAEAHARAERRHRCDDLERAPRRGAHCTHGRWRDTVDVEHVHPERVTDGCLGGRLDVDGAHPPVRCPGCGDDLLVYPKHAEGHYRRGHYVPDEGWP